ncbi:MAG: CTP--2,3-di-O-geranylgeranyl-sn-glycero-1-phosphate cytidyltransferase [Candidatus Nanoarchaeia archaeon]|nr:CTP--2,3-di-O-geranylgeranyl-sn-glycero-1-phosphate cytidyltransferase [Candidatus Nanoarchaeia archaeon]
MEDIIFELKRKLVHISSVIYILIYYFIEKFFSQRTALLTLSFILIALVFLEFLKARYHKKIPFFHHFYRESEAHSISGSIYLTIGVIIAFGVFEFNIAVTAILMMIFGDAASALIGRQGNHKIKCLRVSWEGILSEFLVDIAVGFIFLNNIFLILIMALTATFVEIALKPVDDNLGIPVAAGFAGQSLMIILRVLGLA